MLLVKERTKGKEMCTWLKLVGESQGMKYEEVFYR